MSKPIYRPLFSKATKLLRQQPRLWFLGILAGLINTGAVLEIGFRALTPADPTVSLTKLFLNNAIPGLDSIRLFFNQFSTLSPTRTIITITLISLVILVLLILAILSQYGLFKGALSRNKLKTKKLLQAPKKIFFQILVIDLIAKILVGALLAFSALPLALFQGSTTGDTVASFVILVAMIILVLAISLFSILTIASVVRGRHNLHEAIEETWNVVRHHPLVCFETALLLFLIGLVGALIVFLIWILLWLPYSLIFTAAVMTSYTYATSVVSMIVTLIGTLLSILIGGILTAYQYVVWTLVYEKLRTKGLTPKLRRFAQTLRLI